ncbi:putative PAP-specific phosphatase, mitochondrial isoform X3 [Gossypium hirsutum]|uniref:PAP-specific phosphatase, mitochondrial isoform X3 n=1 Tax=Gossypium hirsutum TaxID=3635 RepID=A0A1U8MIX7_GOSHI|nr:putative PAP-specific phosphatase, mitochondrial isoform X3 [Gossypium hirsutum]
MCGVHRTRLTNGKERKRFPSNQYQASLFLRPMIPAMDLHLLRSSTGFSAIRFFPRYPSPSPLRSRLFIKQKFRSNLPFPNEKAKYHRELEAAVEAVERACRLCVDVQRSLFSVEGRIIEKKDQTPVTVADFGVQALISLELSKSFPSIPLVAEEDSGFLRSNNLVDPVISAVSDQMSFNMKSLSHDDVLEAIDRGGKNAFAMGTKPATYWILDPIDGTRGFVKGSQALYVVGLSLVVEGEIVLGVMGCPNWVVDATYKSITHAQSYRNSSPGLGIIMVAHVGCGTWKKRLKNMLHSSTKISSDWTRCFVDGFCLVSDARFCIPESQTWESLPLSVLYKARIDDDNVGDKEICLLSAFCGSLCKYLMVASGRASVFILRVWDHAVGMICVHEAGGKVTDWKGRELDLAADKVERRIIYPEGGILVTNGKIHNEILEMISSISSAV